MKGKWQKTSLIGVLALSIPVTSLSTVVSNAEEVYYSTNNATFDKQLAKVTKTVDTALKITNEDTHNYAEKTIQRAIDSVIALPLSVSYKEEVKETLALTLFDHITGLTDETLQADLFNYFLDASIKHTSASLLYEDLTITHKLVTSLPKGTIRTKYAKTVMDLEKKVNKAIIDEANNPTDDSIDVTTPPLDWSEMDEDDFFDGGKEPDTGDYLPGYEPPTQTKPKPSPSHDKNDKEENAYWTSKYTMENGQCYKVTTKKVQGKKNVVTKEKASSEDSTLCSVDFSDKYILKDGKKIEKAYDFSKVRPAPVGSGLNLQTSNDDDLPYKANSREASLKGKNQANVKLPEENLENLTIHYTLNKNEKDAYYYETDFKVGENNTISYTQQRDVLFQLAVRSGGKAVEDKDRFLILLENKVIVITHTLDRIPVSTFSDILKGFNAEVKAMETIVGKE